MSGKNTLPSVAVCLAAFNGMRWLPEQMASILAQADVSVQVFVSVDASSDGTEVWVDQLAQQDSRIVVLPHGQRFGGAALNFFRLLREVDFSAFDYVSFADQDDIWHADKLARAHQVLYQRGADAYSSDVTAFWENGKKVRIQKSQPQQRWDFLFEAAGPGCTYVMKKNLVLQLQQLLQSQWDKVQAVELHDWLAYAFARAKGYHWVIDDYAGMLYRQHAGNQVGVNVGWRAAVQRGQKMMEGWGLAQSALIARLVGLQADPFVRRWVGGKKSGLLWLAWHAGKCRRRWQDQVFFAILSLALCLKKKQAA